MELSIPVGCVTIQSRYGWERQRAPKHHPKCSSGNYEIQSGHAHRAYHMAGSERVQTCCVPLTCKQTWNPTATCSFARELDALITMMQQHQQIEVVIRSQPNKRRHFLAAEGCRAKQAISSKPWLEIPKEHPVVVSFLSFFLRSKSFNKNTLPVN